ncbi:uncharacterized protein LOC113381965 [Ctenocephalides felis]|uniref:uncharacterized protein LOC113381965 n=1 Tax=Ctenocephalides felis TaxID=7515 RepID=UPI000E6E3B78|nr:uncharacterized protein LOC113381965 [Ctenocephalides felis]
MWFKVLVLFLIFYQKEVQSWTNYRVTLRSAELVHLEKGYISDDYVYEIKRRNRTYSAVLLNLTTIRVVENFNITVQFYQQASNQFKEFLPCMTIDYCTMINPKAVSQQVGFADTFFKKLKEHIINLLFADGHKLPKSCPILKDNYYAELHIDETKLPSYLLPNGRYKLQIIFSLHGKKLVDSYTGFDLRTYSSEKQKQRL